MTHVIDITRLSAQHYERKACIAMSTIEEVRAAEKRVQKVLDALKKAGAEDPSHLSDELKNATDDYAKAVRELSSKPTAAVDW